jgi:hypothetical protein
MIGNNVKGLINIVMAAVVALVVAVVVLAVAAGVAAVAADRVMVGSPDSATSKSKIVAVRTTVGVKRCSSPSPLPWR